jgi:hypothetical protein
VTSREAKRIRGWWRIEGRSKCRWSVVGGSRDAVVDVDVVVR